MARISQQTRLKKQKELEEIVLELFWEHGAEAITYSEVARRYGTTKSTIQRYYPSQQHFIQYLKQATIPYIEARIDNDSQDKLIESWFRALNDKQDLRFRKSMEFLFRESLILQKEESISAQFEEFRSSIKASFDSDMSFFYLIGRTYSTLTGAFERYDNQSYTS